MFVAMMMTVALAASPMPQQPAAPLELAPGARYDAAVPTMKAVLGHDVGDALSIPDQIVTYLKALHAAAPDRTRLVEYGRTWQDRPLYVLVILAPARLARLDEVKSGLRRLADPRGLAPAEAERLVTTLPMVVWLMHAVHGNETTSSDAALAEAYHVLAAQGDSGVEAILRETVLLIDPLQNPDGGARFIATNQQGRAAVPDPEPASAEHDEAWPGGRSNHYLFDMNRDWLAQSQAETRGRTRLGLDWNPHVVADLHEMGSDSTYYFAPPAEPSNPYITPFHRTWLTTFGRENAKQFDARGFAYFVREVFDSFYPGYGDSWPMFQGAIAMTYEQASPRGLAYRRDDDTVLTFRDGIVHHFTAALTTMVTAAQNRERLLRDYLEYRRSAVAEGERAPVREYLVPPGTDRARVQAFARLLVDHGIEVRRAEQPLTVGARTLPAGSLVIPAAQPMFRLLRNLMEPDIRMDEVFLTEQTRRRQKRLGDQIYDVTAWSLPLLFDVEIVTGDKPTAAKTSPFGLATETPAAPLPAARAAYLIPWGSGAAAAVAQALQSGVRVHSAGRPFTIAGRKYDVGTAIVRVAENAPDLAARLGEMAARWDAEVVALDSTWVDEGMSLGSNDASLLKTPKVLLAWDAPTSSQSAGWARYWLERQFGLPVIIGTTAAGVAGQSQSQKPVQAPKKPAGPIPNAPAFFTTALTMDEMKGKQAVIETTMGRVVVALLPEGAPNHVGYFLKLAGDGAYNGTTFHRLLKHGIIQGGDPLSRDPAKRDQYGTGGLGLLRAEPGAGAHGRGAVSAVLLPGKRDSAGSQFFICVTPQAALDGQFTVFGRVVEGIGIVTKISEAPVDEAGRATDRIVMTSVVIRAAPPPVSERFTQETPAELSKYRAVVETSLGDITIALFADKAPNHVRHFLRLASAGVVDGTSFHRVVPGFVIQTGYLGSKPTILDDDQQALARPQAPEFNDTVHDKGIVSMARGDDPASATTSFFIVTGRAPALDGKYTAFGRVVAGMDVVEAIEKAPLNGEAPVERIELRRMRVARLQ